MNRTISIILAAEAGSYQTVLASAAGATKDFEKAVDSGGASVSKFATAAKVAGLAIAASLAVAAVAALSMAKDFDAAMRNVNSIAQMPEAAFKSLEQQVLDLSKTVPQSATTLAKGLYDIASAGITGADGMTVLTASAKAASAGLSDTQTAAQAIIGVIKAYGLSAADAAHISDVLFQTVNVGILTFSDLAHGLGDVVGTGAAAKVSISELGAAVAAMTLAAVTPAEAFTSLSRLMISFAKPTGEMTNLFHSLGYESAFAALEGLGLHGSMELIRHSVEPTLPVMKGLFGDIRAARGAMALFSADGANYAATFAAIANDTTVAGATQRAFNEQMKSLSSQWDLFTNQISAAAIEVGLKAIPALVQGIAGMQSAGESLVSFAQSAANKLAPFFSGIADAARNLGSASATAAAAFAPLVQLLGSLAGAAVIGTLNALGSALASVTGFLAQNQVLVEGLAILYASRFVTGLFAAEGALRVFGSNLAYMATLYPEFGAFFSSAVTRITAFGRVLGNLSGAGNNINDLKIAFQGLGTVLGALAIPVAIGEFVAIAQAMKNADSQAKELADSLSKNNDPNNLSRIEEAMGRVQARMESMNRTSPAGFWGAVGQGIAGVTELLTPLENNVLDTSVSLQKLGGTLTDLNSQWMAVHRNATFLMEQFQLPFDAIIKFADKAGINLGTLANKDLPWAAAQMKPLIDAVQGGTVANDSLTTSFKNAADATQSATDRVKGYKDALDALIGIHLSVFDANTKLAKAMDSLNTVIGKTGTQLDQGTKAGQDFRDALSGSVDAAVGLAKTLADENGIPAGVKSLQDFRDGLANVLTQAGMSQQAVDMLLVSLGLTDANFTAELSLGGADTAQAQIDAVTGKLKGYTSINPTTTVQANTAPAQDAVQALILGPIAQYETLTPFTIANMKTDPADFALTALTNRLAVYTGSNPTAQVQADTSPAQRSLTAWLAGNAGIRLTASLDVVMGNIRVPNQISAALRGIPFREGGIAYAMAGGGTTEAHIARGTRIKYAEPETGGEAYIPRLGDKSRNLSILRTAAAWSSHRIVPMADGGFIGDPNDLGFNPFQNDLAMAAFLDLHQGKPLSALEVILAGGHPTFDLPGYGGRFRNPAASPFGGSGVGHDAGAALRKQVIAADMYQGNNAFYIGKTNREVAVLEAAATARNVDRAKKMAFIQNDPLMQALVRQIGGGPDTSAEGFIKAYGDLGALNSPEAIAIYNAKFGTYRQGVRKDAGAAQVAQSMMIGAQPVLRSVGTGPWGATTSSSSADQGQMSSASIAAAVKQGFESAQVSINQDGRQVAKLSAQRDKSFR